MRDPQEIVDEFKHELLGMYSEAASSSWKGAELGIKLRQAMARQEAILLAAVSKAIFEARAEIKPPQQIPSSNDKKPTPPSNGVIPASPRKVQP